MINKDKLLLAAEELKLSTLRADEQSIICYVSDSFQIYDKEVFKELCKERKYEIDDRGDIEYRYKYSVIVDGIKFFTITNRLLFDGDEKKLVSGEM